MLVPLCRHCGVFIVPSLTDNDTWLDEDNSGVCADNQHVHAPAA